MYKVYVYDNDTNALFYYETDIIPIPGDAYCNHSTHVCPGHYKVVQRILHTEHDLRNVITVRVTKTSNPII